MEINEVISNLKSKFGDKLDIAKVKEMLHASGKTDFNLSEVVDKIKGMVGDLDGDGKQESLVDELKGKVAGIFHH